MFLGAESEKYVVFKTGEFVNLLEKTNSLIDGGWAYDGGDLNKWVEEIMIDDAVVIRRQDVFSPPAFDAYANSIMVTIEALKARGITHEGNNPSMVDRLGSIADYFHAQADMAWDTDRKIPD